MGFNAVGMEHFVDLVAGERQGAVAGPQQACGQGEPTNGAHATPSRESHWPEPVVASHRDPVGHDDLLGLGGRPALGANSPPPYASQVPVVDAQTAGPGAVGVVGPVAAASRTAPCDPNTSRVGCRSRWHRYRGWRRRRWRGRRGGRGGCGRGGCRGHGGWSRSDGHGRDRPVVVGASVVGAVVGAVVGPVVGASRRSTAASSTTVFAPLVASGAVPVRSVVDVPPTIEGITSATRMGSATTARVGATNTGRVWMDRPATRKSLLVANGARPWRGCAGALAPVVNSARS